MLCASCASPIAHDDRPCPACHGPTRLDERYTLLKILSDQTMGTTYLARRLEDGEHVAIKELTLRRMDSLHTADLFAREARVLQQLSHPQIPAHLDDFVWGVGKHQAFYLVETFISGQTLEAKLHQTRYSEAEVCDLIAEVADILAYLHERSPAIIHRDLKPDNLMRRDTGEMVLIDFGVVRDATYTISGGQTVAGTFGYMAPEQLQGKASQASDLYALGVIAITMLSRRPPTELLDTRNTLRWQPHVSVGANTHALLTELLEPDPTRRASQARRVTGSTRETDQGERHPHHGALVTTPSSTALATQPQQRESIFGLVCLVAMGPLLSLPCIVAATGLLPALSIVSVILLAMIALVPFLPQESDLSEN